jgi:hypothetical protein
MLFSACDRGTGSSTSNEASFEVGDYCVLIPAAKASELSGRTLGEPSAVPISGDVAGGCNWTAKLEGEEDTPWNLNLTVFRGSETTSTDDLWSRSIAGFNSQGIDEEAVDGLGDEAFFGETPSGQAQLSVRADDWILQFSGQGVSKETMIAFANEGLSQR